MKQLVCSQCADILSKDQQKQHNYHLEFLIDQENLQKCINQVQEELFKENLGIQYYDALIDVKLLIDCNIQHLEKRLTITKQYSAIKNKDYKRIFELYDYDKKSNKLSLIIRNSQYQNQMLNELNETKKLEKQINQNLDTLNKVKDIAIQYQKNNQEIQEKLIENSKRKRPKAQDIYEEDVKQKFSTFFPDKKSKKKMLIQSPKQQRKKVQLNEEIVDKNLLEKDLVKQNLSPAKPPKKIMKERKEEFKTDKDKTIDLQILNQAQKNQANAKQQEVEILIKAISIGNLEKASKQLQTSKYTIQELIPKYYNEKQIQHAIKQQLQKLAEHDLYWFFIFTENKQNETHPVYSLFDQKIIGVEALALGKEHIELIAKKYQISQSVVESYIKQAQNVSYEGENDKLLEFMDSSMEKFLKEQKELENKNILLKQDNNSEIQKN